MKLTATMALAALGWAATAQAAAVDLSTWTKEGSGTWVVQPGNDSVIQTQNVDPGVFYSDFQAFGSELRGTIRVNTTSDDDFIGFVLGFNPGDATAGSTDFLLVDWKQGTQAGTGCSGPAGLAISRVTAGFATTNDLWCHNGSVQQLARGTTLGNVGWADNTLYDFSLEYTATSARVFVNGVLELDITGTFSNGRFGFYNYSQQSVQYAGITQDPIPGAVPEPATWAMMILGFGLVGGAMRRRPAVVRAIA